MERLIARHLRGGALVLVALAALLGLMPAAAQDLGPVSLGTAIIGTIPADGSPVAYSFQGAFGDLVTIRATGTTPAMDPNLTLVGPDNVVLVTNDNMLLAPASTAAGIVYRLPETATYTIVVGGTPGDFLLTLDVRPAVTAIPLTLDEPVQLALPLDVPDQLFTFNTNPFGPTTLFINFEPLFVDFLVEVRGGSGELVAVLNADYDNACLSFGPGDQLIEVQVHAAGTAEGTVDFRLGSGPCETGPEPVDFVVPERPFVPVPIEGVCAASSWTNVNIRFGPGLAWPVIALLPRGVPAQVLGVSSDGWYAVQRGTLQGWVFSGVVAVVGPCDALPQLEPPPATPTPTMTWTPIVVTATPTAMSATATAPAATATPEVPATEPLPTSTLPPDTPTVALTAVTSTAVAPTMPATETPEAPGGEPTATAEFTPTATATLGS